MTSLQSLDQLECHFTWKPDDNCTNSNIDEVIEKTKKKITREPHKKAAYLATIAYLYTRRRVKKFDLAKKHLDEALEIDAQIQQDSQEDCMVSSELVIRADMLHLKQLSRGKGRPLRPEELETDMQRLNELDPNSKARAFAAKGVAFDCFGPMKYAIGASAFAEASRILLDHSKACNFYWLYGEAYLRARCDRQTANKHADRVQLDLWRRAKDVGEKKGLTTATFYANYAEAILHNYRYSSLCQGLAEKAANLLLGMDKEQKEQSQVVYIICLKVFRYLLRKSNSNNLKAIRNRLFEDAKEVASVSDDPGFFLELSKEALSSGHKEEAVQLLEEGQEKAGEPGHIWIELKIIELQREQWGKDTAVDAYDSLRETFRVYNKNVATVEFYKAMYLIKIGETKEAVESCVAAFEAEKTLDQIWPNQKENFLRLLNQNQEGFEEYLAWYAENIGTFKVQLDVEGLYRTALGRDDKNDFALEHLGRHFMKNDEFSKAAASFRKLSSDYENKQALIAESLLRDPASDLTKLMECLECGCRDAAPRIFDILERRKSEQKTAERVMADASTSSQAGKDPLFFRRELYELCAKIELTLDDSSSFFIETELDSDDFKKSLKLRIAEFLELNLLTSKAGSTRSAEGAGDRGNLMRSNRFLMTKLQIKETDIGLQEMNNMIVSVLKEAKEVLDRSLAVRLKGSGREFSYPHAFGQLKKQLGDDYKKQFKQLSSETERKAFELESLMKLLKENKDAASLEKVRKCLLEELKRIDPNFHQSRDTRDVFNFMVSREHRILSSEDSWIVRWVYPVNSEKHSTEIAVKGLNQQLKSDWSGGGECRRAAYDVAHLAAEFAEETWAVFSDGVGVSSLSASGAQNQKNKSELQREA